MVLKHGIDTGPWWEAIVTSGTPAGDPGQALGSSLGLELELDQFNLTFDWKKLEKSAGV